MTPAEIVALQAADLRLWLPAQTEVEAYLQLALRVLHSAIDGEPLPWPNPTRPIEPADTLGPLPCVHCGGDHYTNRHDDATGAPIAFVNDSTTVEPDGKPTREVGACGYLQCGKPGMGFAFSALRTKRFLCDEHVVAVWKSIKGMAQEPTRPVDCTPEMVAETKALVERLGRERDERPGSMHGNGSEGAK